MPQGFLAFRIARVWPKAGKKQRNIRLRAPPNRLHHSQKTVSSPAERGTREGKGTQVVRLSVLFKAWSNTAFEFWDRVTTWVPFPSLRSAGDDTAFSPCS